MILKSLSRKTPSYRQLLTYINRGSDPDFLAITHNLAANDHEHEAIVTEFEVAASRMKKRKNGVYLYHEILSAHPDDKNVTPEMLEDVAREYIEKRAKGGLVYARAHMESNRPPHVHLMISSTNIRGKKIRLSIAELKSIRKELESYHRERWPELKHSLVFTEEKERERSRSSKKREYAQESNRRKDREIQSDRRLEKTQEPKKVKPLKKKELIRHQIKTALKAKNQEDFERLLADGNPPMRVYQRGDTWGVIRLETPKPTKSNPSPVPKPVKYRFKTLGIDFEARLREWEKEQERLKQIKAILDTRDLDHELPEVAEPKDETTSDPEPQEELSPAERRKLELKKIQSRKHPQKQMERSRSR